MLEREETSISSVFYIRYLRVHESYTDPTRAVFAIRCAASLAWRCTAATCVCCRRVAHTSASRTTRRWRRRCARARPRRRTRPCGRAPRRSASSAGAAAAAERWVRATRARVPCAPLPAALPCVPARRAAYWSVLSFVSWDGHGRTARRVPCASWCVLSRVCPGPPFFEPFEP